MMVGPVLSLTSKPPRTHALFFVAAFVLCLLGNGGDAAKAEAECAADGTCSSSAQPKNPHPECAVYMAPSTLGEYTSMGIYTGIPLEKGIVINFPEIAVPLLFREFGTHVQGFQDGVLWDRYVWEGPVVSIEPYTDTNRDDSRAVFVPGVGCTVNSVLDMSNIESTHGSEYSTAGLHRSKDPGSGAFTPYHNSKTIAAATLPAGAELFASYGDYWIPDIPGAQVALEPLLAEAEEFLQDKFYPFIKLHSKEMTADMKQALWDFTAKDFPVISQAFSNLPRNVKWADVEALFKENEKAKEPVSVVREFIRRQSIRAPDWLKENGYCQDHLKPGRSTIQQAGWGAFAYRKLSAGTVVGYAPLVHVGLHGLDIWTVAVEDGEGVSREQYDLILNYSYRHKNSTVMLTPYGAGVNYINHGGKDKANVKLRWPDKELIAHKPEYLTRTPYDLSNTLDKIGLSFEYIAIRDIEEGEEVFLDYGDEWEAAWEAHVAQWKPVEGAFYYVHSSEWEEKTYRTVAEQSTNPYPSNLHTMCHESYTLAADGTYQWVDVLRQMPYRLYCKVLERSDDEKKPLYKVELAWEGGETSVVHNVPEDGVFLYDRAFSADWHLPNVFRHEIGLADDILPEAWNNGPPVRKH